MSMYGAYPKVKNSKGEWVEQNGLNGSPKAWPTTDCSKDKNLTVQSARNETNINQIMKRIEKGQLINTNLQEGRFEDISEFGDLESATIAVQRAEKAFMGLPAEVRARFKNDPVALVNFLSDEGNRAEAEELGLIRPKDPEKGVPPIPEPPEAGPKAPPTQ